MFVEDVDMIEVFGLLFVLHQSRCEDKVVYGADDRREPFAINDPNMLKLVDADVGFVFKTQLLFRGNGLYSLGTAQYTTTDSCDLCPSVINPSDSKLTHQEPFFNQTVAPFCSGFLVGK